MKKVLLSCVALFAAMSMSAEDKVWDFSAIFTEDHAQWGDEGAPIEAELVENELYIPASEKFSVDNTGSTSMKKWTTGSYHTRLKSGGSGNIEKNAIAFKVAGNSTIQVCAVSSSGSATRKLVVADANGNIIGSQLVTGNDGKDATIDPPTFEYTGTATTIYVYSAESDEADASYTAGGINFYMISATNAATWNSSESAIHNAIAEKISFNGNVISNIEGLNLSVYNVLGKLVATSNGDIDMSAYQTGVYVVRAEGVKGAMKIRK